MVNFDFRPDKKALSRNRTLLAPTHIMISAVSLGSLEVPINAYFYHESDAFINELRSYLPVKPTDERRSLGDFREMEWDATIL